MLLPRITTALWQNWKMFRTMSCSLEMGIWHYCTSKSNIQSLKVNLYQSRSLYSPSLSMRRIPAFSSSPEPALGEDCWEVQGLYVIFFFREGNTKVRSVQKLVKYHFQSNIKVGRQGPQWKVIVYYKSTNTVLIPCIWNSKSMVKSARKQAAPHVHIGLSCV